MSDGLCYCGEPGTPGHAPHAAAWALDRLLDLADARLRRLIERGKALQADIKDAKDEIAIIKDLIRRGER